jgi:DHA1 family bicyclomycin/chloramphenicol resistance-like MFS transporter
MTKPKPKLKHRVIRSGDELTRGQRIGYILLLGLAMGLIPFAIDPVLPSFPLIGDHYQVDNAVVQWTLTGLSIGLALGQVFVGPLSDSLGRRRPMLISVALFALAELACYFAPNFETFLFLRVLVGIGASGASVIGFAVMRDLYAGESLIHFMGRVFLIQGAFPIIGPFVGSQLLNIMGWKDIFFVFGLFGLILLVGLYLMLIETLHGDDRRSKGFEGMAGRFRAVLRDRIYLGLLLMSLLQHTGLFTYLNTFTFITQTGYGLTALDFGLLMTFNSIASWAGAQVGAWLSRKITAQWALISSIGLVLVATISLIISGITHAPLIFVGVGFGLYMFAFGATIAPLNGLALNKHGEEAGTAASLLGLMNFLMPAVATVLYNQLRTDSSLDAGVMMTTLYVAGLASVLFISRPKSIATIAKN